MIYRRKTASLAYRAPSSQAPSVHGAPVHERGLSLVEILTSILISAPVIAALMHAITGGTAVYLLAKSKQVETESVLFIKSLLGATFELHDAHRLPIAPRIHAPGTLTFTDGTPHPLIHHPEFRPRLGTTPVSAIELDLEGALQVTAVTPHGAREMCARWGKAPDIGTRIFLALAVDGITTVEGSLRRHTVDPPCFELTPIATQSITVSPNPAVLPYATVFIPLRREFTIYLTARTELRYLGHRGAVTIENQPMLFGVEQLTVTAVRPPHAELATYRADVTFPSGAHHPLYFSPATSTRPLYNFLGAHP